MDQVNLKGLFCLNIISWCLCQVERELHGEYVKEKSKQDKYNEKLKGEEEEDDDQEEDNDESGSGSGSESGSDSDSDSEKDEISKDNGKNKDNKEFIKLSNGSKKIKRK